MSSAKSARTDSPELIQRMASAKSSYVDRQAVSGRELGRLRNVHLHIGVFERSHVAGVLFNDEVIDP